MDANMILNEISDREAEKANYWEQELRKMGMMKAEVVIDGKIITECLRCPHSRGICSRGKNFRNCDKLAGVRPDMDGYYEVPREMFVSTKCPYIGGEKC